MRAKDKSESVVNTHSASTATLYDTTLYFKTLNNKAQHNT